MQTVGLIAVLSASAAVTALKDVESSLILLQRSAGAKSASVSMSNNNEEAAPLTWEKGGCRDAADKPKGCSSMNNAGFMCNRAIGYDKQDECGNHCAGMGAQAAEYTFAAGYGGQCMCYYASPENIGCPSEWNPGNPTPTLQSDPVTYAAAGDCFVGVVCAASVAPPTAAPTPAPTPAPTTEAPTPAQTPAPTTEDGDEITIIRNEKKDGKKCGRPGSSDRTMDFEGSDVDLETCSKECRKNPDCMEFSMRRGKFCIGCKKPLDEVVPEGESDVKAYKKVRCMVRCRNEARVGPKGERCNIPECNGCAECLE